MNRRFRSATDGDVDFSGADHSRCVTDSLDPGRAGSHRRAQWPLEAVANRNVAGGHIAQEGRNGEGRQAPRAFAVGGAHGIGNGREASDSRSNDGGGAFLGGSVVGLPPRLGQGFFRRGQGKENEAIHLALFLGRQQAVRIEAGLGILLRVGHLAANGGGQALDELLRQLTDAGLPRQQALPDLLDATAQWSDCAHAGDYDAFTHTGPAPSLVWGKQRNVDDTIIMKVTFGSTKTEMRCRSPSCNEKV